MPDTGIQVKKGFLSYLDAGVKHQHDSAGGRETSRQAQCRATRSGYGTTNSKPSAHLVGTVLGI